MKKKLFLSSFLGSLSFITRCSLFLLVMAMNLSFAELDDDFKARFKEGDIIFHTSKSNQSKAIQKVTRSFYSHMGIILFKGKEPYVFEASRTVTYTPLSDWIKRGTKWHYVVKRLKKPLTNNDIIKLHKVAETFLGKAYDLQFLWSDEKIYCSELVWKIYDRALNIHVGRLQRIKDFDLSAHEVKEKIKARYTVLPTEEVVISPQSMFESSLLTDINWH